MAAGHVYHWRHGWIPLDHTAALSKAKGNHSAANRMLADARGHDAGINSRRDVAKAAISLPSVHADSRQSAKRDVVFAAQKHDAQDVLPKAWQTKAENYRTMSMGDIEAKMTHALEHGDDAKVDHYAGMLEKREHFEKTAATARDDKRNALHEARSAHYDKLVAAGSREDQAYATAFGIPIERVHREQAISLLGGKGYSQGSFDTLSAASHRDLVHRDWSAAEDATNGYMLTKEGERKGIDPRSLWNSNEATVRKYASPELKQWWDDNGRVTLAEPRAELLDPTSAARMRHARSDYNQ